jgi:hypothetical protein
MQALVLAVFKIVAYVNLDGFYLKYAICTRTSPAPDPHFIELYMCQLCFQIYSIVVTTPQYQYYYE